MQRSWPSPKRSDPSSGFTLLELLVVIAILGLLAALVPHPSRHNPGMNVCAAATALAADLRLLRNEANRLEHTTELVIGDHAYALVPNSLTRSTSPDVFLSYAGPEPDFLGRSADRLKFFSDGSSSGGTVFVRDGKSQATVAVNWLDGAVVVHAQ